MNIIELIKCKYDSADVLSNEEKAIIYNLLTFHTDIFEQIEKDIDNICFINGNVFFFSGCLRDYYDHRKKLYCIF